MDGALEVGNVVEVLEEEDAVEILEERCDRAA